MKEMKIFKSQEFGSIRTLAINDEPWFVGKDVAVALGYGAGKSLANAVANHVDEEDKGVTEMMTPGGKQMMIIINESGLYSLVLSSKLPSAREFKRWITHDVIPDIRQHGAYMTEEAIERAITEPDFLIRLATQLKEERAARQEAEMQIEVQKPKVIFADAVSSSHTSILVGELAKILRGNGIEIGQRRLFNWLREHGYLIKRQGTDYNMPTQRAMELGLFEIKEGSYINGSGVNIITKTPKVTGKGQQYFINRFLTDKR
ncbi:phage antirepressor KilAC domain-containing protein [Acidaminococcus sp. DS4831]|uniref:phage antirepressor n=1 Tax=Acidaminococcus sp. DS4831 TaxID=3141399 RepID=UPI0032E41233